MAIYPFECPECGKQDDVRYSPEELERWGFKGLEVICGRCEEKGKLTRMERRFSTFTLIMR